MRSPSAYLPLEAGPLLAALTLSGGCGLRQGAAPSHPPGPAGTSERRIAPAAATGNHRLLYRNANNRPAPRPELRARAPIESLRDLDPIENHCLHASERAKTAYSNDQSKPLNWAGSVLAPQQRIDWCSPPPGRFLPRPSSRGRRTPNKVLNGRGPVGYQDWKPSASTATHAANVGRPQK